MVEPRWRMQKWRLASYQRESRLKSASDSAMRLFPLSQRLPSMGREREGDHARDQDGGGDGHGEFVQHASDDAPP